MLDLSIVPAAATGGLTFGCAFFFVRWVAVFLTGRWDKREAHLDAASKLLIDQLTEQVRTLFERLRTVEADLEVCKEQHAKSRARELELEAFLQGSGDARDLAQLIIAKEKRPKE